MSKNTQAAINTVRPWNFKPCPNGSNDKLLQTELDSDEPQLVRKTDGDHGVNVEQPRSIGNPACNRP